MQAEAIVVSTGGEAYDAVKASDLTIDTGKAITILPQFVGKDSDNDGIPDLVETYGLKPDGTPINSDPNSEDTDGDGLSDNEELGFVPFDAVLHASGEYLKHISYRSDPNNPDTDGDGYIDSLDNNPLIVITAEEIMLMEFCSNAEFHELAFLFGGPGGQNKGFLKWYPNIIDRVRLIEIFRKHAYSPDRAAYYRDLSILVM